MYAKIIGLVVGVAIIGLGFFIWNSQKPVLHFDESKVPADLITAQFIDLDREYVISKFRSGAGHDYSYGAWDGETCRSMKHYFNTGGYQDATGKIVRSLSTPTEPNINIYAPFDGTITDASPEHIGTQVHIRSAKYSEYYARIFHMDLNPGFAVGSKVKSGEKIGFIGPKDATDFALESNVFLGKTAYLSYFVAMTDDVFAPFAEAGFKREDFIISSEYRDAHPFTCGGKSNNALISDKEAFNHPPGRSWMEDFVILRQNPRLETMMKPKPFAPKSVSSKDNSVSNPPPAPPPPILKPQQSSSPSVESQNEPPLKLKGIGINLDYYDPATGRAGDIVFTKDKLQFDILFTGFGFTIPATMSASGAPKQNPQPTFQLPMGTKVRSLVDGVVLETPTLYSGDYSIMVGSNQNSNWRYETEHVINPLVKVGDRVTASQVIAEVSPHNSQGNSGYGLVEIGILKGGNPPRHLCPFAYLDESIKEDVYKKLKALYESWEAYRGDTTLYNEAEPVPGCVTLDLIDG